MEKKVKLLEYYKKKNKQKNIIGFKLGWEMKNCTMPYLLTFTGRS